MVTRKKARIWDDSLVKVRREGCRVCGAQPAQVAHVSGKRHDKPLQGTDGFDVDILWVNPDDVVGLCIEHHQAYDQNRFDLLPYLERHEEVAAVAHLGIVGAYRRLTGSREVAA